MKRITIGRGRECDIRLEDSSDMVSRRQAVITVTPTGKMEIYDTSSNGTFVNGEKVEKPAGKPIKRGDQVNFAHVVDLDWSKVKDPYKSMKITIVVILAAVIVVCALFFIFADKFTQKEDAVQTESVAKPDSVAPADSLKLQIPQETPTASPVKVIKDNKNSAKPKKNDPGKKEEITNDKPKEEVPEPMPDPRLDRAIIEKHK